MPMITLKHDDDYSPYIYQEDPVKGERRVMAMTIIHALRDLLLKTPLGFGSNTFYSPGYRELLKDRTHRWFMSDNEEYGSFIFCCHHLDLDPEAIREKLRTSSDQIRSRLLHMHGQVVSR